VGILEVSGWLLKCDLGSETAQVREADTEEHALQQAGYVMYGVSPLHGLAIGDEQRSGYVHIGEEPGFAHLDGKVACPGHALQIVRRVREQRDAQWPGPEEASATGLVEEAP
jgi:hypothetical protein